MRKDGFLVKMSAALVSISLLLISTASFAAKTERTLIDGLQHPYPAPLIIGITSWINSQPVKLSELSGKVVLIEFWTSTCPFCKEALPYVNDWYKRYHDQGLMVIGIHSPKTQEEQSLAVVKEAVAHYGIHYPVAMDNNFETWDSFNVELWPAFFLIDRQGKVVYVSFGAQGYETIENNIEFLLDQKAAS